MALAVLQSYSVPDSLISSGSSAQILGANCTVGNTVIFNFWNGSAGTVSAVSSPMATTFTRVSGGSYTGPANIETWINSSVTSAADTVTVTTSDTSEWGACGYEVSGSPSSDVGLTSTSGSSAAPSITFPTTATGALLLAYVGSGNAISGSPPGWSSINGSGFFQFANGIDVATLVTGSAGSVTATWTVTSGSWRVLGLVLYPAITAPTLSSETSSSYGGTIEVIGVTVTPNGASTSVQVNYGATSSYGSSTATQTITGWLPVTLYFPVTGLTLGNTYHFQCVATNSQGTTDGSDATFVATGLPSYGGG
jgi:hypothetical protein